MRIKVIDTSYVMWMIVKKKNIQIITFLSQLAEDFNGGVVWKSRSINYTV